MSSTSALLALSAIAGQAPESGGAAALYDDAALVALTRLPTLALTALCALLLFAVALSWTSTQGAPRALRVGLTMLRALLAVALFVVLLEPGRRFLQKSREPNRVVALVDTSGSMALTEGKRSSSDAGETRAKRAIEAVRALRTSLENDERPFVLEVRAFDDGARALTRDDEDRLASGALTPSGEESDLLSGLEGLASSSSTPLGGVVIVSDGADTRGLARALDGRAREILDDVGAPVHTVLAASPARFSDIALVHVASDAFAFVRNKVKVALTVRHPGFRSLALPLTVKEDGQTLSLTEIVLGDGRAADDEGERHVDETIVTLELEPKSAGTHIYTLSVPVHPDEVIAENNRVDFTLEVIRDRIRVLQVAGRPSWDERFVRRLLKENPSVDLISFFILRSPTDNAIAGPDELSLIPFPTRELFTEELHTFDVVILQDFNYRPYQMGLYLQNIRSFVEEAGGGLMMIGGSLSFSEGEYDGTPIADILPVELLPGPGHLSEEPFHPIVTEAGRSHPITDLMDLVDGADPYASLPPLVGVNLVKGKAKDSEVLLAHPFLNAAGVAHPVVAVREVGAGRTLAILTDTTWKWSLPHVGQGGRGDVHRRFLANALRWLIRDPELSRVKVHIGARVVEPGDDVGLTVHSYDARYAPEGGVTIALTLEPLDAPTAAAGAATALSVVTGEDGSARVPFVPTTTGAWRVRAQGTRDGRAVGTDVDAFVVRAAKKEILASAPRDDVLLSIASAGHGRMVVVDDVASLRFVDHEVERIHRQRTEPLWTRFEALFVLAALAVVEWWWRRRRGFV